ncbi:MAG: glycosyltransferase family 2 protein, partial [Acidimicrobiales bacterium]
MRTQAPPVVAVVVAHDPGPWFEEGLAALAAQDYPNLSLLVLDAASSTDLTPRVAAVAPGAFVRRLAGNAGFAAAANHALEAVEGATHLLLCHDDVAPEPDALRQMMEEAYRCNAGLVAPKLVEWDDPARLLSVGLGLDKLGVAVPRVERGELDQSQHDTPRDVFVAPGGFTLVRSDLFSSLGGYDGTLGLLGEDVDLSWRAQVAGARVLVVPRARVRHLEALRNGRRVVPAELSGSARYRADARSSSASLGALTDRHQLRTLAKCYSGWHLVRVLPHLVLTSLSAALLALLT